MKLSTIAASLALAASVVSLPAHAWQQETHRRIVLDAINYMKANPDHQLQQASGRRNARRLHHGPICGGAGPGRV